VAPGTAGSLVGLLLYLPLAARDSTLVFAAVLGLVIWVGVWSCRVCGEVFGEHDSGKIVIDEIAGQLVALWSFPADPVWLVAGFLAFRFYDILKPFPIRQIDRRWASAGGVMADDLLAGLYANLILQVARYLM